MGNSAWDKYLRDMLGDFRTEGETPQWDDFARQMDPGPDEKESFQDETLKETLSNFKPSAEVEGWERIQASLDAADREFDDKVRKRIHHYEPPFDPLSWPAFLKHLSETRQLRIKLITFKVIEFTAILLILLTVVQMGRYGKLPFENPLFEDNKPITPSSPQTGDKAYNNTPVNTGHLSSAEVITSTTGSSSSSNTGTLGKLNRQAGDISASVHSTNSDIIAVSPIMAEVTTASNSTTPSLDPIASSDDPNFPGNLRDGNSLIPFPSETKDKPGFTPETSDLKISAVELNQTYITEILASRTPALASISTDKIPDPVYVQPLKNAILEFGILTQADYNRLRMPEDRFYSVGKKIVFSQQGIESHGFGAGFTLALDHPLWAIETGIIYNAKDFKPGRQLIVGGAFDNGSVEFQAMRLQIVSMPLQYRYRFEPKGRLKSYALAGLGLHVIAQSDIDVLIKYNFPSLSFGENPNNDPNLAQTIKETKRVSEHIRDGAPLSTKSFFTANIGLGLEYTLSPFKTLFLQAAMQYQIPYIQFSNNNGKNIRTVSVQAGVRSPLGS